MKTRLLAAAIHFLAGAFVIFLSLCVIYFIWYPKPFYTLFSVFDAVKIVLIVDLVLGPFLTFVVFDKTKAGNVLMRDISIIVVFQVIALSWGMHITHKMRPLFLVFQGETFYPVIKDDIDLKSLSSMTAPGIWEQPKTAYAEPLKGEQAIQRLTKLAKGDEVIGEMYLAENYRPLNLQEDSEYRRNVVKKALPHEKLMGIDVLKNSINSLLVSQGGVIDSYLFYPIENDTFKGVIVFKKGDFMFSGLISL